VHLQFNGARRLQDAIVLGYQLQRTPGKDVGIPDWYSFNGTEIGAHPIIENNEKIKTAES
jgi:L-arabinokinase